MQIIFLLALPVLMYFLLIRPQQRKLKEQRDMLAAVEEGDEIVTSGGIYGYVNAVEGDTIWLEIAEGVEIRIATAAVVRRIPAGTTEVPDTLPASVADDADGASAGDPEPTDDTSDESPKTGPENEH